MWLLILNKVDINRCDVSYGLHSAQIFDDKVIKFTCLWKEICLFTSILSRHIAWCLKLRSVNRVTNCKISFIRVSNWQYIVLLFVSTQDTPLKNTHKRFASYTKSTMRIWGIFLGYMYVHVIFLYQNRFLTAKYLRDVGKEKTEMKSKQYTLTVPHLEPFFIIRRKINALRYNPLMSHVLWILIETTPAKRCMKKEFFDSACYRQRGI